MPLSSIWMYILNMGETDIGFHVDIIPPAFRTVVPFQILCKNVNMGRNNTENPSAQTLVSRLFPVDRSVVECDETHVTSVEDQQHILNVTVPHLIILSQKKTINNSTE